MSATDSKTDEKSNDLAIAPSHTAQGTSTAIQHDEVFGTITEGGPNYRNVT